jgi:hypothetical protein
MDDQGNQRQPKAAPPIATDKEPGGVSVRWGARFSPQVIVAMLTLMAAVPPLKGAIISGVHWWWDKSYAQVDYVMDDARPNDGAPYIAGHLEGSTEQRNLVGLMQGTTIVVKALPQETFASGKRIPIWHSDDAPNFIAFGDEVNDIPVAALPKRPGLIAFLGYSAWLVATLVAGFFLTVIVAALWARKWGDLPMRRHH